MTFRTNAKDTGRRTQTSCSHCTLRDFDDDHNLMVIKTADVHTSESPTSVPRMQSVGMTVHPMPQDQDQSQQGGQQGGGAAGGGGAGGAAGGGGAGGGGGGNGEGSPWNKNQPKGPSSQGVMMYPNGTRSDPVCIGIDDPRHRPYQTKPGECLYYAADGSGQTIYHRVRGDSNDGLYVLTLDDQQQSSGSGGGGGAARAGSSSGSGQQQQKRFVSIRHVEKQKQQRKQSQQGQGGQLGGAGGGGAGGAGGQQQQDYKHEGDSVNTETRFSKGRIEHRTGTTPVGHFDKDAKEYRHYGDGKPEHSTCADQKHTHIKFDGNNVWCDGGDVYKSKPFVIAPDSCQSSSGS